MKRKGYLFAALAGLTLCSTVPALAGEWKQIGNGWYYEQDGVKFDDGWAWIDGKCYYFNPAGLMASDEVIDGYYVGQDGAWDGKEAVVENAVEWSGHVHLITNEMRGGIATIYDGEIIPQYNPEMQCFIARVEDGQGAGIKNILMDVTGRVINYGYDDAIWLRKDGYLRVKYCYEGTEQEADDTDSLTSDVLKIALGSMKGSKYYEFYDWSGTLIDKQYMKEDGYWLSAAKKAYPAEAFTYQNVVINCVPVEGGFILTDAQGQKAQMINVPRSSQLQWNIYGNLLEFYDKSGECEGIYWIQ